MFRLEEDVNICLIGLGFVLVLYCKSLYIQFYKGEVYSPIESIYMINCMEGYIFRMVVGVTVI